MSKSIAIFYHKEDWIAIFCRLKDVFYFVSHRAKSDIFQRKNSKLQQILSVFKTLCPLTFAPPLKNQGLLQNEVHPKSWTQLLRCIFYGENTKEAA